jgi:hypothetical protein
MTKDDGRSWSVYVHRKPKCKSIFYIGICLDERSSKRPYEISRRSEIWKRTFQKYGRDVEIIKSGLTKEEASRIEMDFISKNGKKISGGSLCNITDGGEGFSCKHTDESKLKMSISKTGNTGALCHNSIAVCCDNVFYASHKEAARVLGCSPQTIVNRVMNPKFNYFKI